jgi:D-sedoheptulose 7-phosphate isomerase
MSSQQQRVEQHFQHSMTSLGETVSGQSDNICLAAKRLASALLNGGKVLLCGNGGSAAMAQYMASLLLNRYERERPGLPALALSADPVSMTSIAADQQYKSVFARQIKAYSQPNDILVLLVCGKSTNNLNEAIAAADDRNIPVILLSSEDSSNIAEMLQSDALEIRVPARSARHCLEVHLTLIHCLCNLIDVEIFGEEL